MSSLAKLSLLLQRLVRLASNPAGLRHVLGTALHETSQIIDPEADIRPIPAVTIEQLSTAVQTRIQMQFFPGVPASISPLEACALALLIHRLNARAIFEFGTYKGVSTTQLALNVVAGSQVLTLDLPDEDQPRFDLTIDKPSEREIALERGKGSLVPADLLPAITFLRQDSARFEPAPYVGAMDLVFVDGAHSADYVRNDSEKGWQMLRSGGILVWHDCVPSHPDVVRFVRSCGWSPQRVAGTRAGLRNQAVSVAI